MSETPVPTAALAHHIAFLGKTGSGKSNAAKTIVEGLLDAGERVCILDPTGAWYGLRLTRDGTPSAYPVVIFGGQHADLPIGSAHGAAIAEMIGTSSTPAVIDTRLMTVGERTRFFTDFAETLLRKNRGPLTFVIDEAHLFAPQGRVADPQSGKMLHAANNLVSLGRSIGLRVIMLSQRPAKLHKDSLTQVETLVAMRLIAPQDRAAIEAWIGEWADPTKGREIIASLPSLPTGDAWIWSPEIGVLKREHFPLARTFDSGKAPTGDGDGPALAPLDLAAVTARLEAVAADVVANDPKALKAEIARLKAELAKPRANHTRAEIDAAAAAGLASGLEEGERRGIIGGMSFMLERLRGTLDAFQAEVAHDGAAPKDAPSAPILAPARPQSRETPARAPRQSPGNGALPPVSASEQRVLDALAWWKALGHDAPTNEQIAFIAGYRPTSGGFANLKGSLRSKGLIEYPGPSVAALTAGGAEIATAPDESPTAEALRSRVLHKLAGPQRRVLGPLIDHYPEALTNGELAEAAGYAVTSGGFANLKGSLRTLGCLDYPTPGASRAADWLFP